MPPLRERKDNLSLLTSHFLKRFNGELKKSVRLITPEVMDLLQAHNWPGNIRELESVIRFAMVHSTREVLTADCLPESCRGPATASIAMSSCDVLIPTYGVANEAALDLSALTRSLLADDSTNVYREIGTAVDQVVLDTVLRHVNGNQQQAAEYLGISRMTLRNKLRALGRLSDRNDI